ncbi:MAG: N-acetylmuramoyl-L-alanine amidase [Deltaproteobacteria bacterium]|nr:N-acetylmuramoyl-L-alanine amidase [Deltaproteobacteria bacterium]
MRRSSIPALLALALLPLTAGAGPFVVLDPGHGGIHEGAMGVGGVMEKSLALEFAFKAKATLEKAGFTVVLTRDRDVHVKLVERVAFSNGRRPDLFISLHCNSMPTRALRERFAGIQTFFLSADSSGEEAKRTALRENTEGAQAAAQPQGEDTLAFILKDLARSEAHQDSSRLAAALHARLLEASGAEDRGVQQAPLFVLMGMDAPAALVELGFIAHPEEGKRLQEAPYQQKLVDGLVAGVKDFLQARARAAAPVH